MNDPHTSYISIQRMCKGKTAAGNRNRKKTSLGIMNLSVQSLVGRLENLTKILLIDSKIVNIESRREREIRM